MTNNIQKYVAGFLFFDHVEKDIWEYETRTKKVLLVRKNKPAWQKGKLNGIGGKIEEGETPDDAMHREFFEETGIEQKFDWKLFVVLKNEIVGYELYFYKTSLNDRPNLKQYKNDIGEILEVHSVEDLKKRDKIKNLEWLIPLAFDEDLANPIIINDIGNH